MRHAITSSMRAYNACGAVKSGDSRDLSCPIAEALELPVLDSELCYEC